MYLVSPCYKSILLWEIEISWREPVVVTFSKQVLLAYMYS